MIAQRKPKPKGKVGSRIKALFDTAAAKGEKQYQSDMKAAEQKRVSSEVIQTLPKSASNGTTLTHSDRQAIYAASNKRKNFDGPDPRQQVATRKSSGMYKGSVPVAGTASRKLMKKRSQIGGIRKSDASPAVKKSMIRKMKGSI
jgi:hypothetical protein